MKALLPPALPPLKLQEEKRDSALLMALSKLLLVKALTFAFVCCCRWGCLIDDEDSSEFLLTGGTWRRERKADVVKYTLQVKQDLFHIPDRFLLLV